MRIDKTYLRTAGLCALSIAFVSAHDGQSEDVPAAVKEAVMKKSGGTEIEEIKRARDYGTSVYEVELENDTEYYVSENGTILEQEREISLSDLPAGLAEKLTAIGGELDEVEERRLYAMNVEPLILYEVEFERGGEVVVDAYGRVIDSDRDDDDRKDDDDDGRRYEDDDDDDDGKRRYDDDDNDRNDDDDDGRKKDDDDDGRRFDDDDDRKDRR